MTVTMTGTLSPERRAVLQQRLTEADSALHALMLGTATVSVAYEGESVTFRQTDEAKLRRYIGELQRQLGLCGGARRPGVYA